MDRLEEIKHSEWHDITKDDINWLILKLEQAIETIEILIGKRNHNEKI